MGMRRLIEKETHVLRDIHKHVQRFIQAGAGRMNLLINDSFPGDNLLIRDGSSDVRLIRDLGA